MLTDCIYLCTYITSSATRKLLYLLLLPHCRSSRILTIISLITLFIFSLVTRLSDHTDKVCHDKCNNWVQTTRKDKITKFSSIHSLIVFHPTQKPSGYRTFHILIWHIQTCDDSRTLHLLQRSDMYSFICKVFTLFHNKRTSEPVLVKLLPVWKSYTMFISYIRSQKFASTPLLLKLSTRNYR